MLVSNFGSDLINVTGGTLSVGNNVIVNIDAYGGSLSTMPGDYPLIDFVAATNVGNISTWTVGSHAGDSGHTYSFTEVAATRSIWLSGRLASRVRANGLAAVASFGCRRELG